ncbi:hypothetical protein AXW96_14135 [Pseudomonas aeruginosa]|nr:hypothetical protein M002_30710 [Pseudomonas aeruginosa ID4365]RIZ05377.1 hypothetical protein AXW96_14135 [Pseudomonas aeruginosa]
MLLAQDLCGDCEIGVRVEQIAGAGVAVLLIAEIDLAKARVYPRGRYLAKCLMQAGASFGSGSEALRFACDIERPGPGDGAPAAAHAAFLKCYCVQHRRGNAGLPGRQLIGRWRDFLGQRWTADHADDKPEHQG